MNFNGSQQAQQVDLWPWDYYILFYYFKSFITKSYYINLVSFNFHEYMPYERKQNREVQIWKHKRFKNSTRTKSTTVWYMKWSVDLRYLEPMDMHMCAKW